MGEEEKGLKEVLSAFSMFPERERVRESQRDPFLVRAPMGSERRVAPCHHPSGPRQGVVSSDKESFDLQVDRRDKPKAGEVWLPSCGPKLVTYQFHIRPTVEVPEGSLPGKVSSL